MFPYYYLNRARARTYRPEKFNEAVIDSLSGTEKPIFLSAHFLLPHHPFTSAKSEPLKDYKSSSSTGREYRYRVMLKQVDNQLRSFFDALSKRGLLKNSVVLLISDHGEGFENASFLWKFNENEVKISHKSRGHGTNVLDQNQFRVLLSYKDYRHQMQPQFDSRLASLVDIYPTVIPFTKKSIKTDGMSLLDEPDEEVIPPKNSCSEK